MATSMQAFKVGLYEEHLEDISFLYEQRTALVGRGEIAWREVAPFEARLEAHLDGLLVGGELALSVCRRVAQGGDFGQLFGAASVYCRLRQAPLLAEVLGSIDFADAKKVSAVTDALKYALPPEWSGFIEQALSRGDARLVPMLCAVVGHRRLHCAPALMAIDDRSGSQEARLRALGRLRHAEARDQLRHCLDDAESGVRLAAMIGLMRLGDDKAIADIEVRAAHDPAAQLALGVGGRQRSVAMLRPMIEGASPSVQAITALGVLGDPACVPWLIDSLGEPSVAPAAAEALQLVTGAGLYEDAFSADRPHPDELSDEERGVFERTGALPTRKDGKPYGVTVRRISRDAAAWQAWWRAGGSALKPGSRFRLGRPFSATVAVDCLGSDAVHPRLRALLSDEYVARFGEDAGLETDAFVVDQIDVLRRMRGLAAVSAQRLAPGGWHYAGRAQ